MSTIPPEAPAGRPSDHLTSGATTTTGGAARFVPTPREDPPASDDPGAAGSTPEVDHLPPDNPGSAPATPSEEATPVEGPGVSDTSTDGNADSQVHGDPTPEATAPPDDGVPPYPAYPAGVTEGCGAGSNPTSASGGAPDSAPDSSQALVTSEPTAATPGTSATPDTASPYVQAQTKTDSATGDETEEEEEEGGGPVKPFLDHLEDLRWMLIKVISSIALGMLVCLVASDKLVSFLMWPLKHAQTMLPLSHQRVPLLLGTNQISKVTPGSLGLSSTPSNRVTAVAFRPVWTGTNYVVTFEVETHPLPAGDEPDMVVLKNYGPISAFMVALKLALYGGLVLSSPFVIFFIGQFVLPALKVKEKAFLYRVAGFGSVLFIAGIAFCYFLIIQVALMASVQFSQWMGFGADEWRAEDYVSFVSKFMLGMGLSFQLPLVILTLVKIGLVSYQNLSAWREYFIIGNLVVSAVVTPSGDPLTMVLMALPLQVLYEASLLIARSWARKEAAREAAGG